MQGNTGFFACCVSDCHIRLSECTIDFWHAIEPDATGMAAVAAIGAMQRIGRPQQTPIHFNLRFAAWQDAFFSVGSTKMNDPQGGNLFDPLPPPQQGETFSTLLDTGRVRIERIVSHHHASPPGFWYEQAEDEWVVLLRGAATLEFDDSQTRALSTGDWLRLPAHCRHRIAHTDAETLWLAVHMAE